jgi:hypothetical protein
VNKFLQFAGFKLCWLGLIVVPAIAVWPVAIYWAWSLWLLAGKARYAVILMTLIGCVMDSILLQSGVFSFIATAHLPVWMVLLWGCFSLVLVQVLAGWLKYWYVGAFFGAVTGPFAYWGGAVLGGQLVFDNPISLLLTLAPCWALLLAIAVYCRFLWSETDDAKDFSTQ